MNQKETAYKKISELVTRFDEQFESYKNACYNETLTRRDFIDPFFKALGWDIDNEHGYAESYREVIHEDRVKVGKETKAPDYSFRLVGGKRLFFVEAKKPSVSIKDEVLPAYQVRRYGWSAKLAVSIITDFEEFAIYDCTRKPLPTDKASVARIKYITYHDYLKEFDFIWETFSQEYVLKGSFDKFILGNANKKGTATVDKEFLLSLDNWRTYLATSISWRNKQLNEDELNFVVQQTLDRIIFLRIAEDRNVEPYGNLKNAIKQGDYYQNLFSIFHEADEKYNSGLFDFKKDTYSRDINIDNKVIKNIITDLYYPVSPYEFSVLSVEILGSAYEQFLGKVIRITPAHHAVIEEKPEVRKAGGVYYTPQYVVEYIVENTVGKLIIGKTPAEVSKIKIVDPACGSGSFLIGAFQRLLDWHKDYYTGNGKVSKGGKGNPLTPEGNLTTAEKKRILLNNIYGVDIDVNAVEVTKLSLLLKCMEGETEASIATQFSLFHERVLPTLDNNIKDGNSLIDIDYYASQLDFGEEKKIKPFSWQKGFPEVFKQGGFDVVIGNPPYVRSKLLEVTQRDYFFKKYKSAKGTFDLYTIFIEQGFNLIKENGSVAFINPNKYFYSDYGVELRKVIAKNYSIESIFDFNEYQVFEGITTYTSINIFSKKKTDSSFQYCNIIDKKITKIEVEDFLLRNIQNDKIFITKVESVNLNALNWVFKSKDDSNFINRIKNDSIPLIDLCYKIYQGFVLTPTEVFPVSVEMEFETYNNIKPIKQDEKIYEIEKELLIPILKSSSIFRYHFKIKNYYSVFPYKYINDKTVILIPEKVLKEDFPKGFEYLKAKSNFLKKREKGRWANSPNWYEYSRKQNFECQKMKKILVPGLATNARYSLADENIFIDQGSYGIILNGKNKQYEKFILGVLNSHLLDFILKSSSGTLSGGYYSYQTKYLSDLPIKIPEEKAILDNIVKMVENLNDVYKELSEEKLQTKITQLEGKIDYCEQRINEIVYQLYDLTEEEIKIVEAT
jgi:hypothetical protein